MILLPQKVAYRGTITDLRISAVDGTAFIDNLSGATLDLGSSVVKATGTAAIRISSVDGTAFVDTSDATLAAALAANAGKYLVITDASGRYLKGWIKAAGTGETLGDELFTNGDCSSDTGWVLNTGWSISGGKLVKGAAVGSYAYGYQNIAKTAGALYFGSFDVDSIASSNTALVLTGTPLLMMPTSDITGTRTGYATYQSGSNTVGAYMSNRDIATAQYDNFSLKRVLTPSATGATIVSTKGGTTYNFESKDASFTYNATSYTYTIYDRDVTALADGNHLIEIYDASGNQLKGYLSAAGDGEGLGDELVTTWMNAGGSSGFETLTLSGSDITEAINTTGIAFAYPCTATTGRLYNVVSAGYTLNSGTAPKFGFANGASGTTFPVFTKGGGAQYYTCPPTISGISISYIGIGVGGIATNFSLTGTSIKPVLTPSTSGATIVSAKGGATANFAYKDASFTYNAASYQVIVRAARGDGEDESVYIPQFTTDDVAGVTFGGFYVSKFINSQPSARNEAGDAWYDVAHGGAAGSVVPKSKRGVPVWDYINFPQAMIACANKGKGWHLISAFEWASLAFLSKKLGTMPHGGNNNVDPPADVTYTTETAQLDKHLKAEGASYNRPLPGTGPAAWAHNHLASGVYDLNGLVIEWVLLMMSTDGYPYVPANLDTTYTGSPYGRGTISGSGGASPTLTVDGAGVNWLKDWTVDEFNGCYCYIAEAASGAGALYAITDTTATTVVLTNGDAPGNGTATFAIFKLVATDITNGMTSGHKILTLRDADADLKAFALPATADATGADAYGKDAFYFNKAAARAAGRGGPFHSAAAGVFFFSLSLAPSTTSPDVGFRAAKAL